MAAFKLYHVVDKVTPKVAMGTGVEANWPTDYHHVADIDATDVDHVYRLSNIDFNKADGGWAGNEGVQCKVKNPRSTAPGDVVVCPDGKVVRFMMGENEVLS